MRKYISKLNHGNTCTVSKSYLHQHKCWSCENFPCVPGFTQFYFQVFFKHLLKPKCAMLTWLSYMFERQTLKSYYIYHSYREHLPYPVSGIFRLGGTFGAVLVFWAKGLIFGRGETHKNWYQSHQVIVSHSSSYTVTEEGHEQKVDELDFKLITWKCGKLKNKFSLPPCFF